MKYLAAIALSTLLGTSAFAGIDQDDCASKRNHQDEHALQTLPIKQYHYGMRLDIADVIWLSDHTGEEGLVQSQMIYRDKQGEIHRIQYTRDLGWKNQNG